MDGVEKQELRGVEENSEGGSIRENETIEKNRRRILEFKITPIALLL